MKSFHRGVQIIDGQQTIGLQVMLSFSPIVDRFQQFKKGMPNSHRTFGSFFNVPALANRLDFFPLCPDGGRAHLASSRARALAICERAPAVMHGLDYGGADD